eukprot:GHVL01006868.1.p1 GENE.GHVL01006868.1~~GHVL01006868.1.p1  ORF type:complete len:306 (+),score=29.97 GHVL01006868.1:400-1317(+)
MASNLEPRVDLPPGYDIQSGGMGNYDRIVKTRTNNSVKFNPDYFNPFRPFTVTKAYWYGYFTSAGRLRAKVLDFFSPTKDESHLDSLREFLGAGCLYSRDFVYDKNQKKRFAISLLTVANTRLVDALIAWGIPLTQLRSQRLKWLGHHFNELLIWHFVRGFFDGEGCLVLNKNTGKFRIALIGTQMFLEGLKILCNEVLQIPVQPLVSHPFDTFVFWIEDEKQVISFLEKIYENSEEHNRLNRKYQRYLLCKELVSISDLEERKERITIFLKNEAKTDAATLERLLPPKDFDHIMSSTPIFGILK